MIWKKIDPCFPINGGFFYNRGGKSGEAEKEIVLSPGKGNGKRWF
jgi:hypothetical protein